MFFFLSLVKRILHTSQFDVLTADINTVKYLLDHADRWRSDYDRAALKQIALFEERRLA